MTGTNRIEDVEETEDLGAYEAYGLWFRYSIRDGEIRQTQRRATKKLKIPWSESASELYRPSDRRLSAK
jgi:hypothetical protein